MATEVVPAQRFLPIELNNFILTSFMLLYIYLLKSRTAGEQQPGVRDVPGMADGTAECSAHAGSGEPCSDRGATSAPPAPLSNGGRPFRRGGGGGCMPAPRSPHAQARFQGQPQVRTQKAFCTLLKSRPGRLRPEGLLYSSASSEIAPRKAAPRRAFVLFCIF